MKKKMSRVDLEKHIENLSKEPEITSSQLRDCIETLIKINRNIQQHPDDEKYKQIKISNQNFNRNVWKFDGAREFLIGSGLCLCLC